MLHGPLVSLKHADLGCLTSVTVYSLSLSLALSLSRFLCISLSLSPSLSFYVGLLTCASLRSLCLYYTNTDVLSQRIPLRIRTSSHGSVRRPFLAFSLAVLLSQKALQHSRLWCCIFRPGSEHGSGHVCGSMYTCLHYTFVYMLIRSYVCNVALCTVTQRNVR